MAQLDKEKAEKQEVAVWIDRIIRGEKLRDKRIKEAKKYIEYYKSNQWIDVEGAYEEKPVTNLIFSHIKSQIPFLYFQNPKWYVKPRQGYFKFRKNANTATMFLNYYASENMGASLKKHMRLAILDAHFIFGCIKTAHVFDTEVNKNFGKPKISGYTTDNEPIYEMNGDRAVLDEQEDNLVNEKFISRRVSPARLIFDTESESYFEDGRFVIEEINVPLGQLKKDKKYKNTKNLKETYSLKPGQSLSSKDLESEDYCGLADDIKRTTIYEIWDIENKKLKVVSKGNPDKFLRNIDTPLGIEGHPYSFLVFNTVPDEAYPLSDMRALKGPQDENNKALAMIATHAKKSRRKYGYLEGAIDEDQVVVAESGADGAWVKVKELPLREKVVDVMPEAPLAQSVGEYFGITDGIFRKISSTTEADRGAVERKKTAYEASKIYGSADLRKEDRRSQVEDFASDVGSKLLQSMQANLTAEDVDEIAPDEKPNWVQIKDRSEIEGQFSVSVVVASASPKLPEYERNDFMLFMQALTQFPPELIQVKVDLDSMLDAVSSMFPSLDGIKLLNTKEEQEKIQKKIDDQKRIEQLMMLSEQMTKNGQVKKDVAGGGSGNAAV